LGLRSDATKINFPFQFRRRGVGTFPEVTRSLNIEQGRVVEHAVLGERVSGVFSLFNGERTGKNCKFGLFLDSWDTNVPAITVG
jgi:hypothetical protein